MLYKPTYQSDQAVGSLGGRTAVVQPGCNVGALDMVYLYVVCFVTDDGY